MSENEPQSGLPQEQWRQSLVAAFQDRLRRGANAIPEADAGKIAADLANDVMGRMMNVRTAVLGLMFEFAGPGAPPAAVLEVEQRMREHFKEVLDTAQDAFVRVVLTCLSVDVMLRGE